MPDQRFDDIADVYERLAWDARKSPIPEEVTNVMTKDGLEQARQLVNHAIHQQWTTVADLQRRTGMKKDAIYNFKDGKWKGRAGTEATVASDLAKVINHIIKRREAVKTEVGGFATTRLVEAIYALAKYAMKRNLLTAFLVPAGQGKTMTLNQLQIETPAAVLLTTTQKKGSVKSFLQLWAHGLGLNEMGRAEDIQDRIIQELRRSERLILIDEAHKLRLNTLDVIREVWDAAHIPIVMAATPSFREKITSRRIGVQSRELMDQFYRRVTVFRDLTKLQNPKSNKPEPILNEADIRKVFERGKVRIARDGIRFLCKLGNTPGTGGLGVCDDLVQIVVDLLLQPGEAITRAYLQEAMKFSIGPEEAGFRMDYADIEVESPATATR